MTERMEPHVEALLKQATLEIRRLRSELDAQSGTAASTEPHCEPVAIVGMGCRFPSDANTPDAFWNLLKSGRDAMGPVPTDRWDVSQYPDSMTGGGFLSDVRHFDPRFFGISPREAESMDPQQRLLLEVSYEALEHAGLPADRLRGSATGVFVGICFDDYAQRNVRSGNIDLIDAHSALGNNRSIAAGRIAYSFDFKGPVVQLDTTCSSSLVSLHLACNSLRSGESSLALAGGVNLMLSPEAGIGFNRLNALSPDGRCHTFDESAQGYARGEGCGILVLKRLSDARRDGDKILALVRGSALNHDGASNGLTAPSGLSQQQVITAALANAGLRPDQVQYVEAHGTATPLGDPIELQALAQAYQQPESGAGRNPLLVGSVKTNIGHLESAAGVAGLIKVVLSMQAGEIPAHLNFVAPSSRIPWSRLQLQVVDQLRAWPDSSEPRRAGISSFGMSGTNAHVILEQGETPDNPIAASGARPALFTLSAKSPQALKEKVTQMIHYLQDCGLAASGTALSTDQAGNLAANLAMTRSHFAFRYAFVAQNIEGLLSSLQHLTHLPGSDAENKNHHGVQSPTHNQSNQTCFLNTHFHGQEALARSLENAISLLEYPVYFNTIACCEQALGIAMMDRFQDPQPNKINSLSPSARNLFEFVFQLATLRLMRSWGVIIAESESGNEQLSQWLTASMELHGNWSGNWSGSGNDLETSESLKAILRQVALAGLGHNASNNPSHNSGGQSVDQSTKALDLSLLLSSATDQISDSSMALESVLLQHIAKLYEAGLTVQWDQLFIQNNGRRYSRLTLPNYPFQRQSYWQEPKPLDSLTKLSGMGAGWPGFRLPIDGDSLVVFLTDIGRAPVQWHHHQVADKVLFPTAGYLSIAYELAQSLNVNRAQIGNLRLRKPWWIESGKEHSNVLQSHWTRKEKGKAQGRGKVQGIAQAAGTWNIRFYHQSELLAEMTVNEQVDLNSDELATLSEVFLFDETSFSEAVILSADEFYQRFQHKRIAYGESFRLLENIQYNDHQAKAELNSVFDLFPQCLDAGLQLCGALMTDQKGHWLPVALDRFDSGISTQTPEVNPMQIVVQQSAEYDPRRPKFDIQWIHPESHTVALSVKGLMLAQASSEHASEITLSSSDSPSFPFYRVQWMPSPIQPSIEPPLQHRGTLSSPDKVHLALSTTLSTLRQQPDAQTYLELQPHLENLALQYAFSALVQLRLPVAAQADSLDSLCDALNVTPAQRSLFSRLLCIVAKDQGIDSDKPWQHITIQCEVLNLDELEQQFPRCLAEIEVVERCGEALVDVLQGRIDPVQLLFPQGDLSLLTDLYEHSPGASVVNGLLKDALTQSLSGWTGQTLRVIEIGAGTGGTSAHVLPVLHTWSKQTGIPVEYCFTDVSPHFLHQAAERFAGYDFVQYRLLDVSEAVSQPDQTSFDLVIAANVLHATGDIRATVRNVQQLLRPQGQLLLLEATQALYWLDLVFGMMPGWWLAQDQDRNGHPLLGISGWQTLLQETGFESVSALQTDPTLPQTVFAAQRSAEQATWLVLANETSSLASRLYDELTPSGDCQITSTVSENQVVLNGNPVDRVVMVVPSLLRSGQQFNPAEAAQNTVLDLLECVNRLAQWPSPPRLSLVTAIDPLLQGMLWSCVQTIQLEYPQLNCTLLTMESDAEQSIHSLVDTITHHNGPSDNEHHILWANNQRYVARLQPYQRTRTALVLDESGTLDGLTWVEQPALVPDAHEVLIEVQASGLNFRDVLLGLGQYPEPGELGAECYGIITSTGESVKRFKPGDKVLAIASNSFDSQVVVDQRLVVPINEFQTTQYELTRLQAATLPVAYVTAAYSLLSLANLQAGETVLIHNASGGVGLAAIQIALGRGALVLATASQPKQQAVLEAGAEAVYDSRDVDFAEQILADYGEGVVDVVLSALPRNMQQASLMLLNAGSRFVDIGKGQSLSDEEFSELAPYVQLHRLDLVALCQQQPDTVQQELCRMVDKVREGAWAPLPLTVFSRTDIVDGFRTLQRAEHIGKVIIADPELASNQVYPASNAPARICGDKTYLITGGLGALGLLTAEWLIGQGARSLCLVSRKANTDLPEFDRLRHLSKETGTVLRVEALDITDRSALHGLIESIQQGSAPLTGVLHAAGVLSDSLMATMTADQLRQVLSPKVDGGWLLHELTQDIPLDCFVLFSSAAGVMGSPGQINHAAANGFLDGLARHRRQTGLPALSLAWGAWSEVGSALKYQRGDGVSGLPGVGTIEPQSGINMLSSLWSDAHADTAILPIDWKQCLQLPQLARQALFASLFADSIADPLAVIPVQGPQAASTRSNIAKQLTALSGDEQTNCLQHYLIQSVAASLGLNEAELDVETGMFELGLDSLTALELKNRLQVDLGLQLPSTVLFDYPNIRALVQYLLAQQPEAERKPERKPEQQLENDQDLAVELDRRLDQLELYLSTLESDQVLISHSSQTNQRNRKTHS